MKKNLILVAFTLSSSYKPTIKLLAAIYEQGLPISTIVIVHTTV